MIAVDPECPIKTKRKLWALSLCFLATLLVGTDDGSQKFGNAMSMQSREIADEITSRLVQPNISAKTAVFLAKIFELTFDDLTILTWLLCKKEQTRELKDTAIFDSRFDHIGGIHPARKARYFHVTMQSIILLERSVNEYNFKIDSPNHFFFC